MSKIRNLVLFAVAFGLSIGNAFATTEMNANKPIVDDAKKEVKVVKEKKNDKMKKAVKEEKIDGKVNMEVKKEDVKKEDVKKEVVNADVAKKEVK